MVNFDDPNQIEIKDFVLPFSGRLDPNNKWIHLSRMIPYPKVIPIKVNTKIQNILFVLYCNSFYLSFTERGG